MELIIIDLNKELIDIETLYINLPIDVQRRVNRYKIEDDKKRSIIAWNIVHQKLDLKSNKVFYNENGKPFIDNKYFSISCGSVFGFIDSPTSTFCDLICAITSSVKSKVDS